MSSFISWDSKITTVNALLGGVSSFVREKMKIDGIYNEFIAVTQVSPQSLVCATRRLSHTFSSSKF